MFSAGFGWLAGTLTLPVWLEKLFFNFGSYIL
jgi:hypothetical protein